MDYEQKYKEALERAKMWRDKSGMPTDRQGILDDIFPELAESEDERIKKEILNVFKQLGKDTTLCGRNYDYAKWIAWLEKQGKPNPYSGISFDYNGHTWGMCARDNGVDILLDKQLLKHLENQGEQKPAIEMKSAEESLGVSSEEYNDIVNECLYGESKPADKEEPKFHEGDWIIRNNEYTGIPVQVIEFKGYYRCNLNGEVVTLTSNDVHNNFHLWTIQDAKDGDVLQLGEVTAIFKKYIGQEKCICYCSIDEDGVFEIPIEDGEDNIYGCTNTTPATKEQRDTLFVKIKEAGYEWFAGLRELRKLPTPADVGFEELDKAWAEEANKQNLANSAKTCKKSQRMVSAEVKEALYDKPAWTEEDDEMLDGIILRCEKYGHQEQINWLKSLKERIGG